MTIDIAKLRSLAEAATPGPWTSENTGNHHNIINAESADSGYVVNGYCEKVDARFIAAAHPQAVLALLDQLEAVEREIDRWRHGNTIEGDFVCPNELDAVNLRAEVAASQQETERLRALLARMKRFADDGVDALEESGEDAEECAEYRDTIAHIAKEGGVEP